MKKVGGGIKKVAINKNPVDERGGGQHKCHWGVQKFVFGGDVSVNGPFTLKTKTKAIPTGVACTEGSNTFIWSVVIIQGDILNSVVS